MYQFRAQEKSKAFFPIHQLTHSAPQTANGFGGTDNTNDTV